MNGISGGDPPAVPLGRMWGSGFEIRELFSQARLVLLKPSRYYRQMPRRGGIVEPLLYVVVMSAIAGGAVATLHLLSQVVGVFAAGFAGVVFYPLLSVVSGFLLSGLLFLVWKLMGSPQNYETAFRCWAASTAIYPACALLSVLPYAGVMVSVGWTVVLMIEASVAVHSRGRPASRKVFGVLGVLVLVANLAVEYDSRQMMDFDGQELRGY
ncbi:MAG: YIP1 family protein [Parahaliea sp.]